MNPLMGLIGGTLNGGNSKVAIFMQAIAAAFRGETPESFLSSLAKKDPRFQGFDFNDLEKTANNICQQKGIDPNAAMSQVKNEVTSLL